MPRASPPPRKIPPFHPVPLRARRDGWTPARQVAFIARLAETRSVRAAAEAVGMGRESAYRLRGRPGAEEFAGAWNAALPPPRWKSTVDLLEYRALHPRLEPVLYPGRWVATREIPDDRALLAALKRALGRRGRSRSKIFG